MDQFYSVFIVLAPGLEQLGMEELKEKSALLGLDIDDKSIVCLEGGLECSLKMEDLIPLVCYLKIPTRILLRLGEEFKARDFPKLYKKTAQLEHLKDFLIKTPQEVKCTTEHSRLIHSSKIKETVLESLNNFFKAYPPKKKIFDKAISSKQPVLHIRMVQDKCQISLDITGGNLFKRGQRKLVGVAPLRENLAAALFYFSKVQTPDQKGILDPMCGSASILLEAQNFYCPNPWGNLCFQSFPLYWKNQDLLMPKEINTLKENILNLRGQDIDPQIIKIANENFNGEVIKENFWELKSVPEKFDTIVMNPPWDKRIKIKNGDDSFQYQDLIKHCRRFTNLKSLIILLPKEKIQAFNQSPPTKALNFRSSGINLSMMYWCLN